MKPMTENPRRLNRRDFLRFAGLAGSASFLAACAADEKAPPEEEAVSAPEEEPAMEEVALTFWTPGGSDQYCAGFTTIAENYMKENPNITMNETQCNPTGEEYTEVLLANIAAGDPPDATIVWSSPVTYAVRGALEPLDDAMAISKNSSIENWSEGVLASCQYKGITYGLPAAAAPYGMYYNADMFEAAGISSDPKDFPKNWDDLRALSKEFTRWEGDLLVSAGFFPWGGPDDFYSQAVEFVIWSHCNGGGTFDAANLKYIIDSEQNIELMRYALEWFEEEYKGDLITVNTSGSWGVYGGGEGRPPAWAEGVLAIKNDGYWIATDMYDVAEVKFESWNVAPYPVGPSGSKTASGYWPNWLVIPKGVPHKQESFDYLDYMVVDGMKVWYGIVPDLPANKKFPKDFVPPTLIEKVGEGHANAVNTFFHNQLNDAAPMWNSPVEDFYLDQLSVGLEQIMNKVATPEEALGAVQTACQDELDKLLMG
jgi:ABC-type glycerol-3-phosphate transport system substrate-binding protein